MKITCNDCGSDNVVLKIGSFGDTFKPKKITTEKVEKFYKHMKDNHSVCSWFCTECEHNWVETTIETDNGNTIVSSEPTEFLDDVLKNATSPNQIITKFQNFNRKLSSDDKAYLNKMRINKPNRDIPSDIDIEVAIQKIKKNKEKVIGDLIIRDYNGEIEFELT